MAFPGGHREPSDPTLQAAAEREASEEIGLDLSGARLLGSLDMLHPMSQRRRFALFVVPFVYQLEDWPPLSPGPEVADVHTFSLSRLVAGEGRGEMDYHWEGVTYKLPCIRLEGTLIWGMTLRMIDDLLGRLHA